MVWHVFRKHALQITCWQLGQVTAHGLVCIQDACTADPLLQLGQVTVCSLACIREACTADHLLAARTGILQACTADHLLAARTGHGLACHALHIYHLLAARTGQSMWPGVCSGSMPCRSPAGSKDRSQHVA